MMQENKNKKDVINTMIRITLLSMLLGTISLLLYGLNIHANFMKDLALNFLIPLGVVAIIIMVIVTIIIPEELEVDEK